MATPAFSLRQDERSWWLRALLVLTDPRRVFAALRDDSDEAMEARQEPLAAVVVLAGIGGVLATSVANRLLDEPEFDALLLAVWAVVAGAVHGGAAYFAIGALVYLGASFAGGLGTYRRGRQILGFASVPLVLSLGVVLVRAAVYGSDAFRAGGADEGAGGAVFDAAHAALFAWAAVLLVIGVRTVHGWSWPRALAASALPLAPVALAFARAYGAV